MKIIEVDKIITNVEATEFSYEGYGVARIEKFPILIDGLLKGEIADIKITSVFSKYAFAKVIFQHKKVPERIEVKNNNLNESGNAPLLVMKYDSQLEFKTSIIKSLFKRELNYTYDGVCLESPNELHYRNKATVHVIKNESRKTLFDIGYFERNSHKVVEQTAFDLVDKELEKLMLKVISIIKDNVLLLKEFLTNIFSITFKYSKKSKEYLIIFNGIKFIEFPLNLFSKLKNDFEINVIYNLFNKKETKIIETKILQGKQAIIYGLSKQKYLVDANSFFQINEKQIERIYTTIQKQLNLLGNELIVDAYAGVGSIGISLAKKAKKIVSVESNKNASFCAIENAKLNYLNNVECVEMDTEWFFEDPRTKLTPIDIIIFDPPRSGLSNFVIKNTIEHKIRKIVYLSCNPRTMVRDIKEFNNKGYQIDFLQAYDMFPQTPHIETLCILSKNDFNKAKN
ncbi:hypothetical protein NPL1_00640 [Metamycoplasma hyosynoviae]|uniref:23S rRNA (uracil(1939)-C(5))-methyltransferase RlmD n=1 Tax=Metamycoplasma hyosynoviae TaxID=29559 RepID=UPI000461EC65|nr:23S rRNA (uracil(1939)-C(5))-methyltransferase RlmD [Metamycoplasma hyosynoviae]KDE43482.1 hypothetical protein NPL1_00640 [Metamycoplasma hyosynoviae]